jgi:nucleoside-triphosphatase THEP1
MQHFRAKPLRETWLKASVIGSIWASVEIILGSFLHNLRIPLSGTILSFIGVWILISFLQVWRENGLIWRAGLICALMKSISPSAIILGPMIGIFSEALLIELFVFILGKNPAGYMIGGAFAVLSTLIQKIINLLILYGFDLIKILADLYKYGVRQIGIESLSPELMVLAIAILYMIAGITGAAGGFVTGTRYMKNRLKSPVHEKVILQPGGWFPEQSRSHNYSLPLLLLNLFALIAGFLLLNLGLLIPSAIIGASYITFCFIHYKNALRRLRKISFWITFLLITFAATFIWKGLSQGTFFTYEGFMVGLKMNARAIVLITGFAAISEELKNPVVKSILYHRGFASLYQSLNLAFSALPYIISTLRSSANGKKGLARVTSTGLPGHAEELLKYFKTEHEKRAPVIIITGAVHEGKTTFLRNLIPELKSRGIRIAGIMAAAVFEDGKRKGYNLINIETSEITELCTIKPDEARASTGRYFFNNETVKYGLAILDPDRAAGNNLIVIDEIGPLELKGQGWAPAVELLTKRSSIPQIWVVRENLLTRVLGKWSTGDAFVFRISESKDELIGKINQLIKDHPATQTSLSRGYSA